MVGSIGNFSMIVSCVRRCLPECICRFGNSSRLGSAVRHGEAYGCQAGCEHSWHSLQSRGAGYLARRTREVSNYDVCDFGR